MLHGPDREREDDACRIRHPTFLYAVKKGDLLLTYQSVIVTKILRVFKKISTH
jgi:hypothetical protein